jgi:hypothetical protein
MVGVTGGIYAWVSVSFSSIVDTELHLCGDCVNIPLWFISDTIQKSKGILVKSFHYKFYMGVLFDDVSGWLYKPFKSFSTMIYSVYFIFFLD